MKNSIEEDITKINTYIELILEKDYCNCNELNTILGKHCDGSKNVAYAMQHILSDYKRVLKENEILKEEKEQAWEEWNSLEQGSYETEQKLKQQIKESQKENEELRAKWDKDTHILQNKLDYANADRIDLTQQNKELRKENEELKNKINQLENMNEFQSKDIEKAVDYTFELNKEIEIKDQIIDLMSEMLNNHDIDEDICKQMGQKENCNEFTDKENCKNCIKQYFENKLKK